MNHEDVLARFKEVGVTDTFGTKKEVKELPLILDPDEVIMYATSGFSDGNTWLITCTNKRLLFLDKGMFFGLKQVEIPIDKINSISHKKGMLLGEIVVHHGSSKMVIKNIQKDTLSPMVHAINTEIEKQKTGTHAAPNHVNTTSAADEILKFKELLDADIITQEEFDKKKKELLGM